ncbi:MAG: hypothetical protein GF329_08855 [Candidatus Lokiarchaeota archaeon]|nr:hypothetical protein [Candidatus Lokiarchaeota archaeon]
MLLNYYMARYATDLLYIFEFLVVISLFAVLMLIWKKSGKDGKTSLLVYIISGLYHTGIELLAQGTGVREVPEITIGTIIIGYPFLPFVLGLFEGGIFCLIAYHFVRYMIQRSNFSKKFILIFTGIILFFLIMNSIKSYFDLLIGASGYKFTAREIFSIPTIIIIIICFAISFGYFFLNKNISKIYKKSFIYWYIGLVIFTLVLVLPLNVFGIRYIASYNGTTYVAVSIIEQILVLYIYSLSLEAAGFFLPIYIILYQFKIIQFEDKIKDKKDD